MPITSGLVDAHSHLRALGYREQGIPGPDFETCLLRMNAGTPVDVVDDVFVAASDLLLSGVTGVQVIAHSFGPVEAYLHMLDQMVQGIRRSGIRALIILGLTDQAEFLPESLSGEGYPDWVTPSRGVRPDQFGEVFSQVQSRYPDLAWGVGPVGPQWCSASTMGLISELAQDGARVHTHFLESVRQRDWAYPDPLSKLRDAALLGPQLSLAHAVWCSDAELDEIAQTGTTLVACPRSNELLSAGRARYEEWTKRGISWGVGLDSAEAPPHPWQVASLAEPESPERLLTTGGLACTGVDTSADEVVWADRPGGLVNRVTVNGRVLVDNARIVDEADFERARQRIYEVWSKDASHRQARLADIEQFTTRYLADLDA